MHLSPRYIPLPLAIGFIEPIPIRPRIRWDVVITAVEFDPFHRILLLPLIDPHRYSGPQIATSKEAINVKASLGVCFALSRNYVSSYRGTAIMRKKMHASVF